MFRSVVLLCLVAVAGLGTSTVGQDRSSEQPRRPLGVPEASLPCTPEEQAWWKELREAANDVKAQYRAGEKEKKKFLSLLHDGIAKSYKPPIPDSSRPVILFKTEPRYTEAARLRGSVGTITLEAELRANGSVGEIKILQPLDPDLDQSAADAARKTIFLPAVKNREFVSANIRLVMQFNLY